jgi:TonB-dependent receptor
MIVKCLRNKVLAVISAVFFSAMLVPMAVAQGGKGTIKGRVTDPSDAVLQGAQIAVEPNGVALASDVSGQFFINSLEPGTYTLTVSYVGFKPVTKTVTVVGGQVASADVKLDVQSQNEQVLVTAERVSAEAEAVNRERTADNIVQVLPDDVIRSLPNANLADALGRLPSVTLERDEGEGKYVQVRGTEPRLTNTTIDGVNVPSPETGVRQIKFDSIPADIVESVEINKTLQANMDGDGIGGSINLVTKTAGERPTVALSGMNGYTPILGGRSLTENTGTIGQRFGATKRFGLLVGGSYDWNGRGIDDIEPVSDIATALPGQPRYIDSMDVREYRYYRTRWGLAGSSDYKLGDGSNIYARFLYSDFQNYGDRWVYSINDNNPNAGALQPSPGVPSFNTEDRRPDIAIASFLVGGKHVLSSTWYSWDLSVSRSRDLNSSPGQANFSSTLSSSSCQYDPGATTDLYRPQFTPSCFSEAYDPTTMALSDIQISHGKSAQLNLQAAGAMAKRYHIGSRLANIEIGGKFRNAHKFDDSFNVDFTPTPASNILLSQFANGFTNSNYYGGTYQLGYNPNYQTIRNFLFANPAQFTSLSTFGADPSNYGLTEKVSAGYLMNTVDLNSRVRAVAGVRFEGTNLDTLSFDTTLNTLSDKASGSYVKILPSASLRYAFNSSTNLRLVYGRGLARPDPQDIAQSVTFTTNGSPGSIKNTATLGNPALKAETADNFDVLIEHYLNPFGMITAGFFYKNLTDPIVTKSFVLTNFQPSPVAPVGSYTVTQPINAGSAWISGFEAAYLQHFTFLPWKLGGLGLSANYGYTASRASGLGGRSDHPRLLRNAPNTWNISPTYDLGRVSIRVGLSYNQANIASYNFQDGTDGSTPTPGGLKGPFGDVYFYSHLQVDAQGSVRLSHGLNFIMYGLNLTNEVFGFYQGSPQYMIQREYYTPTIAAGFRWSPIHEK